MNTGLEVQRPHSCSSHYHASQYGLRKILHPIISKFLATLLPDKFNVIASDFLPRALSHLLPKTQVTANISFLGKVGT